jgi:hypothetical protein
MKILLSLKIEDDLDGGVGRVRKTLSKTGSSNSVSSQNRNRGGRCYTRRGRLTETRRRSAAIPFGYPKPCHSIIELGKSTLKPRRWRLSKSVMDNVFAVLRRLVVMKSTVRRTPMSNQLASLTARSFPRCWIPGCFEEDCSNSTGTLNDTDVTVSASSDILEDIPSLRSNFPGACAERTGISEKGVLTEIALPKSLGSS